MVLWLLRTSELFSSAQEFWTAFGIIAVRRISHWIERMTGLDHGTDVVGMQCFVVTRICGYRGPRKVCENGVIIFPNHNAPIRVSTHEPAKVVAGDRRGRDAPL
jgi:hypothetical protein